MHQTFTGSSRRPRQVNLSGRKPNPFAATGSPSGSQQALQSAHDDRIQRQRQRAELTAAKNLQRTWRGHSTRRRVHDTWRAEWDAAQQGPAEQGSYRSTQESLAALRLLLIFCNTHQEGDIRRLLSYGDMHMQAVKNRVRCSGGPWPALYLRLERICLSALGVIAKAKKTIPEIVDLSRLLTFLVSEVPIATSLISRDYYWIMAQLLSSVTPAKPVFDAVTAPLDFSFMAAYEGFATAFLTTPQSSIHLHHFDGKIDRNLLIEATANVADKFYLEKRQSLWLLSQFIYLITEVQASFTEQASVVHDSKYISIVSKLLATIADSIDAEAKPVDLENDEYDRTILAHRTGTSAPLNVFLHRQISRLIDQDAIRSLLVRSEDMTSTNSSLSNALAGYALTLLRVFPKHADDIRMWLYLGPSQRQTSVDSVSAVAYFWKEARNTKVFRAITQEPRSAIDLLTASKASRSAWQPPSSTRSFEDASNDWRAMLVFFELYTFVLKLMDDEEFLGQINRQDAARTRNNALPLDEVKDLTSFLKNLGFAMYYHAQDISQALDPTQETLGPPSLSKHFGAAAISESTQSDNRSQSAAVGGITGMSVGYVKGLVTGLLRAIYERDSRRNFLPKGHWLMTSRFDMVNFIQAVVVEEESRNMVQEQEDEDDGVESEDDFPYDHASSMLSRDRRMMESERRQRAQRKAIRRRHLETITPRLEILQNMPFLIPFETRVEIFREFVRLDMNKRRNGFVDPDVWRQSVMYRTSARSDPVQELQRHHAKIRRKHEFEDAYNQFYELGADLKEPIQITFVDEFDIVEAGIDGGGVTKEFLTSVSSEAFDPKVGMFRENSDHLLYPNPTMVEELKEDLKLARVSENLSLIHI